VATEQTSSRTTDASSSPQRPPTAAEQRANEHAGTTDTEVLARDIAQTREELAVTIDAIVDRVSPKKVVERSKQQAREGVQDATEIVKGHATTAAGMVKEKALVASEVVKEKVAEVKEKVSGTSDATPPRSPLGPATSVSLASATPMASSDADPVSSTGTSPLPATAVSVDAGEVPPPEPAATTGSLADAADAGRPGVEPAGADLPSHRPVSTTGASDLGVPPVYAGAAAAALFALVLLLLRRRRS
jgi:MYXO-CTERM domain-containing protein